MGREIYILFCYIANTTFKKSHWLQGASLVYPSSLQSQDLPDTLIAAPASMIPLLGLTQYLRGAVVFTLKHTFRSVGLPSFRLVVTTSVKGPTEGERETDWGSQEESLED